MSLAQPHVIHGRSRAGTQEASPAVVAVRFAGPRELLEQPHEKAIHRILVVAHLGGILSELLLQGLETLEIAVQRLAKELP